MQEIRVNTAVFPIRTRSCSRRVAPPEYLRNIFQTAKGRDTIVQSVRRPWPMGNTGVLSPCSAWEKFRTLISQHNKISKTKPSNPNNSQNRYIMKAHKKTKNQARIKSRAPLIYSRFKERN